jgi:hypothetical protein
MKKIVIPISLLGIAAWIILFLANAGAQAQPIITDVKVDSITDTSVRVQWRIDSGSVSSQSYGWVVYGVSEQDLNYTTQQRRDVYPTNRVRGVQFSGLAPATRYYFRPVNRNALGQINANWSCVQAGSFDGYECESPGAVPSFVTLPASTPESRLPHPPETFTVEPIEIDGETFTVNTGCTNLMAQLQAAVNADPGKNHRVVIPAGTRCLVADSLTLPRKTSANWIEVRTSTPDSELGMPGTRITPADQAKLASIVKRDEGMRDSSEALKTFTACNYFTTGCSQAQAVCGGPYCSRGWRFVGIEVTHVTAAERPTTLLSISSISNGINAGSETVFEIRTATPHGLNFFQTVHINGVRGYSGTGINGIYSVGINSPVAFTIRVSGAIAGQWETGTGLVSKYVSLGITEVTASSPIAITTLDPHGLNSGALVHIAGVTGLEGANGSRRITVVSPTKFTLDGSIGSGSYAGGGILAVDPAQYLGLVAFYGDSYDMVLDRCWIHGQGFPTRILSGVRMNGVRNALINSTVDNINAWRHVDPVTNTLVGGIYGALTATVTAINMDHGGPHKIVNNFINSEGIVIFANDGAATLVGPASDVEIQRNYITMDPRHRYGSSVSDGLWYPNRYLFEAKKAQRVLLNGNVFENCWADNDQQNGSCFVFTPRVASRPDPTGSKSVVSDITFTNNVIHNVSGGPTFVGGEQVGDGDTPTTSRIHVANNLFYGTNYYALRTPGISSPSGGAFLHLNGAENVLVEHNTVFDNRGTGPALLVAGGLRGAHLVVRNNIFTHNHDNNNGGFLRGVFPEMTPVISDTASHFQSFGQYWHAAPNPDSESSISHNVIIPGVRNSRDERCLDSTVDYDCNYSRAAAEGFWAGFSRLYFPNGATARQRMAAVGFEAPGQIEGFRLRSDSSYAAGKMCDGQPCATDGKAMGVDIDQLLQATQAVRQLDIRQASGSAATISFHTKPGVPCLLQVGEDTVFRPPLASRVDSEASAYREVVFDGLPDKLLYVRVSCGGGDLIRPLTAPVTTVARVATPANTIPKQIELQIAPPPLLGPVQVVVDHGSTNSLGTSTPANDCEHGCRVKIPAVAGARVFYRVRYLSPNGGVLLVKPGKILSVVVR